MDHLILSNFCLNFFTCEVPSLACVFCVYFIWWYTCPDPESDVGEENDELFEEEMTKRREESPAEKNRRKRCGHFLTFEFKKSNFSLTSFIFGIWVTSRDCVANRVELHLSAHQFHFFDYSKLPIFMDTGLNYSKSIII